MKRRLIVAMIMLFLIGMTLAAEARHGYMSHPTGRLDEDGDFRMTRPHWEN